MSLINHVFPHFQHVSIFRLACCFSLLFYKNMFNYHRVLKTVKCLLGDSSTSSVDTVVGKYVELKSNYKIIFAPIKVPFTLS